MSAKRTKETAEIGKRMAGELLAHADASYTVSGAAALLGVSPPTVRNWWNGMAPSTEHLRKAAELGLDVVYILTGKRGGEHGR